MGSAIDITTEISSKFRYLIDDLQPREPGDKKTSLTEL
jgi:hypothetical protein